MKNNWNLDPRLAEKYFLADYFNKTSEIISKFKSDQIVTMQWFQRKNNSVLAGIEYVLQMIKVACPNFQDLKIQALSDGSIINEMEPVLKISGKYTDFAFLEGLIDGALSRATSIATNSKKVVDAANGKTILNMNDRADLYSNQAFDGYASYVGGIRNFVTPSALEFIDDESVLKPQGTMPHALIASFDGDIIKAAEAFQKTFPQNNLVILIDYNNDCVVDAAKCAKHFGQTLKSVRIDTSFALIDKSLVDLGDKKELHGVNPTLIKAVRKALDENGGSHVKIIASSGFNQEKIAWFEKENTPVDIYGVGEAIVSEKISFTGDIVLIDNKPQAKVGRKNIESDRLRDVKVK
jgi:nicotinate phosphoribosyltransferase